MAVGPGIPMSPMEIPQVLGVEQLRDTISRHIRYTLARPHDGLKPEDYLRPLALAIRDRLVDKMMETEERYRGRNAKRLYYLSMEFLIGRSLADNIVNLGIEDYCRETLEQFNVKLEDVLDYEPDEGLDNGGLGRLAACFLVSLATMNMPCFGYGIDYVFGLFKQEIHGGWQRE